MRSIVSGLATAGGEPKTVANCGLLPLEDRAAPRWFAQLPPPGQPLGLSRNRRPRHAL